MISIALLASVLALAVLGVATLRKVRASAGYPRTRAINA